MPSLERTIAGIVDRHIEAQAFHGAAVLVARGGDIIAFDVRGVADMDPAFALDSDTVYAMMSMSKSVTAALAMMLISEGKVGLDDPVHRYIPEFARPRQIRTLKPGESYPPMMLPGSAPPPDPGYDYAPATREITVRMLSNFTSGLQTIGIYNGAPPTLPTDTLGSYIPKLADLPLEFEPGTQWHYSNLTSYDVLGRIIEIVSGQTLQDFAQTRLFGALGMTQTRFGLEERMRHRLAPIGFLAKESFVRTDYPTGSAGVFSTIQDLARFAQMLLQEGTFQGQRIMAAEAVRNMAQGQIGDIPFEGIRAVQYARPVHAVPSAFTYGFGVGILARETTDEGLPAGSYGWDGIGTRRFWVVPSEQLVIVMIMPGMGFGADAAHKEIEATIVDWARSHPL